MRRRRGAWMRGWRSWMLGGAGSIRRVCIHNWYIDIGDGYIGRTMYDVHLADNLIRHQVIWEYIIII